ncbi:hypothetical protein D6T64_12055 [Cryobacterium melibiosiphilum]|uniref:Uncharacterized protein n=1 Tax=Cryobacterium melibiosiphilum TaxID=995039 RepID=A0A3A5MG74_9MICO|nr:hypothetical protein [Cryobacterium melibiosiphilum]RJT88115.1 hypothetical protein D6T64_12055 [Cryobacterium melibiosiphilum]
MTANVGIVEADGLTVDSLTPRLLGKKIRVALTDGTQASGTLSEYRIVTVGRKMDVPGGPLVRSSTVVTLTIHGLGAIEVAGNAWVTETP